MFRIFTQVIFFCTLPLFAYPQPGARQKPHVTKVMTLGVFHFQFPNLDVDKIAKQDQIDVLDKKYQKQLLEVVSILKEFKPDEIFVEARPAEQRKMDSLFQLYKNEKYTLGRNEVEQLGFRLAAKLGLNRVQCVDTWGKMYNSLDFLFNDTASRTIKFEKYYFKNPDTVYIKNEKLFKGNTPNIISTLIRLNNPKHIKESLGPYLIGHFKYEEKPGDYTGADFEAARWFDRNLRIFRNIQRSVTKKTNRILVIFGAGHMNILNYLFECSPEYQFISPEPYLKKALINSSGD